MLHDVILFYYFKNFGRESDVFKKTKLNNVPSSKLSKPLCVVFFNNFGKDVRRFNSIPEFSKFWQEVGRFFPNFWYINFETNDLLLHTP